MPFPIESRQVYGWLHAEAQAGEDTADASGALGQTEVCSLRGCAQPMDGSVREPFEKALALLRMADPVNQHARASIFDKVSQSVCRHGIVQRR